MLRSSGFRPISQRLWNLKGCAMWQLSVSSHVSHVLNVLHPGTK